MDAHFFWRAPLPFTHTPITYGHSPEAVVARMKGGGHAARPSSVE